MATFTNQLTRLLTLSTPLGDDVLLLTGFSGQEALSQLFNYQLEIVSEEEDVRPADIVGKNVTWGVQEVDKETRWFNGHVCAFSAGATRLHDRRVYRMEVVPYLWFLTRTANCRIFQNKTTPQIIEQVFTDYGLKHFELSLRRSYPEWEYCVQYRETAFNFVARLMEHEGIFYYFRHENGKHTLVVADHKCAYKEAPESPVDHLAGSLAPNHIDMWEHRYQFRTGRWTYTDYNFKTPGASLLTTTNTLIKVPGMEKFEVFDYPGEYPAKGDGQVDVRVRMEEEEAGHDVVTASGGCPTFSPGLKFTLNSHEIEAENGQSYVVTSIHHLAADTSQHQSGEAAEYHNTFTCIPADVIFRPQRLTPKPVVQGPQTAVVVGPKGEEIYTDEHGRVKVQFHWDRYGKKDEKSSCWMRVSQVHAGKKWGGLDIPRVGEEVIVDFLEGDPDRPLITGRVYNAEHRPPVDLPAQKMVSGLKSNTYPGGGGFNQLTMDDTKGKEMLFMNSQYDKTENVNNDRATTVGNDSTEQIGNNRTTSVGVDSAEQVGNNMTLNVGNNLLITAGTSITLKCGAATIHMNQAGIISITGTLVTMAGSINANVAAPVTTLSGLLVTSTGAVNVTTGAALNQQLGGVTNVTGGVVNINC